MRFFIDWTIEVFSIFRSGTIIFTIGSLCIGICLYIHGMVTDLKASLESFNENMDVRGKSTKIRSIYIKAICLHIDIIE